ncbi:MerR family transcriptional regulator [Enterococcus rivorum]|uniref:HTH merR-type domain-containing protein n=1 Tax=Enterococcus rivorum TaxID=762845 RepID=A0A1E5L1E1_9ENTE|nr:MerR family transcriptional regulator [Enterococcus rivorum]MBP2098710.1 DNA-binding transcriptional MerR regulator [Enterococcus rivorum]OEH83904.1 hypothetical protein BCR26_00060 [Enterococcus rivorum]
MFKIGEFSRLSQVSIRMLRYYDEQGLLTPAKIDEESGYRFYQVQQLPVLEKIVLLRNLKFSVAEIAEVIQSVDESHLEKRLNEKYQQIEKEIELEKKRLLQIEETIQRIKNEDEEFYHVSFKTVPKESIVSLRKKIPTYFHEGKLWVEFGKQLEKQKVDFLPGTPDNITIFHDECYHEESIDIEICLKVKEIVEVEEPLQCYQIEELPLVASIFVKGPYEKIASAYGSLAKWLDTNKEFEMSVPTRQIAHRGPCEEMDSENYLTELQIPLKKSLDSNMM